MGNGSEISSIAKMSVLHTFGSLMKFQSKFPGDIF